MEASASPGTAFRTLVLGAVLGSVCGGPRDPGPQAEWTRGLHFLGWDTAPGVSRSQRMQIPSRDARQKCQENALIDWGQRCREGFFLDVAQRRCRVCPCPLSTESNNFAASCREVPGGFQCRCKAGHVGERCQRCAPGFYGNPLAAGGRCRACTCAANLCNSRTGVCRYHHELQDRNPEQCQECDSCAKTLLDQLEKLDVKLMQIQNHVGSDSLSPSPREHLRNLEKATRVTMSHVSSFSSAVGSRRSALDQLEQDTIHLADDMYRLKELVRKRSEDLKVAQAIAEKHMQRAKDLDTEAKNLLKETHDLLKQIENSKNGGTWPFGAELLEVEKMLKEMEKTSFAAQIEDAKREQAEAKTFLENVRNITQQCNENKVASRRLASLLSSHQTKLAEPEKLLNQAREMVRNTSRLNKRNMEVLRDIPNRVVILDGERKVAEDQILLVKQQLRETEDLLKMFQNSKTELEQLSAQVSGAESELQKKVRALSQVADQEAIVKQAEDHAEALHKLAASWSWTVGNNTGWDLSGIHSYENITDALHEAARRAEEAANTALDAVSKGDVIARAKSLKANSSDLLKDAKAAGRDLKGASKSLKSQMGRLGDAEKKKKLVEEELRRLQDSLGAIHRDDVGDIIAEAKKAAAAANSSATDTLNQLDNITAEIKKFSISPGVSNTDALLDNVQMTVKNLSDSLPSLLDKVEELSSQIGPEKNVTDNINRIKKLIEQAREAANRIVVPMKFMGNGHVELRPPKDVDDLRAYTALTLYLQRPEKPLPRGDGSRRRRQTQDNEDDQFVLFLGSKKASGDFLGMALRDNTLHFVYKLSDEEYDVEASNITASPSEPASFDKIEIRRIYQDAKLVQTKQFTSSTRNAPETYESLPESARHLLDLSPHDLVFYVGGYPDDFTPPESLNYGKYKGCIEFTIFNERFISLYNFRKAVNVNLETPCKRNVPGTSPESDYFQGSGYAKVFLQRFPSQLRIYQTVETRLEDALLLYLGDESDDFFYSVSLERGRAVLRGKYKDEVLEPIKSAEKISLSPEVDLKIFIVPAAKELLVRIGDPEIKSSGFTLGKFSFFYIGGVPDVLRQRYNISLPALRGCVKMGTAGGISPNIVEKVGVGRGCSEEFLVVREAELSLGSSLKAPQEELTLDGDLHLSLGFRSRRSDGVLLQNGDSTSGIELSMRKGFVLLNSRNGVWKSTRRYHDGKWHYLSVIRRRDDVEFRVDEDDVGLITTESASGPNSPSILLGAGTFEGCLANLYFRRPESLFVAEDLSSFSSDGDVWFNSCRAEEHL